MINLIIYLFVITTLTAYSQASDSLKKSIETMEIEPQGIDYGEKVKPSNIDSTFKGPERMPSPIEGIEEIQGRINYPQEALENRVEGKVYVLAYIDEYGDVKKAQVIKGIGSGCDEEALKVVKETKFTPGFCNGKPCKVQISIPIMFSLE